MRSYPTVLLHHVTRQGSHYDWLIGGPDFFEGPEARLVTLRVPYPTGQWAQAGVFTGELLPPHRRLYLTYQGPITGERGQVRRVDQGQVLHRLWTAGRRVLAVRMERFTGEVELCRLTAQRWQAAVARDRALDTYSSWPEDEPGQWA